MTERFPGRDYGDVYDNPCEECERWDCVCDELLASEKDNDETKS